jgi:transcriptional regulator with PAS, ATPase and Fis domain
MAQPAHPAPATLPVPSRRRTERRRALSALCQLLPKTVGWTEADGMRERFLAGLRRVIPAAGGVTLREWRAGDAAVAAAVDRRLVAVDVPTADPRIIASLDFVPAAGCAFDSWDHQAMSLAGRLAGVVLEIEHLRRAQRQQAFRHLPAAPDGAAPLIGSTPAIRLLRDRIERVAATDFTVLIEGESGTGKELVARQIHELSPRRHGPFVAVNCAAIVDSLLEAELFGIEERTATGVRGRRGKFEHADAGTLFLDEVSDLSASAQAKLLRAIQDLAVERVGGHGLQRVDIRIVAATNRSLRALAADGLFRADLFYRLSGVELQVPPLRQRQADILELARYFLERHRDTRRLTLSPEVGDALVAHDWPGNVRELQRVIESVICLARGERAELSDLPPVVRGDVETVLLPSFRRNETLRYWASRYARLVWQRHGNKRAACRALGISYHTLQSHLRFGDRMVWVRETLPPDGGGHDRTAESSTALVVDAGRGMTG